ncbi:MAG: hypothetical protein DRG33_07075 [Deltaproteobacteria bacterium]|nr:MAG: hypothetical protein DRG33_07075 [Deltaproteobacteria bacterium]
MKERRILGVDDSIVDFSSPYTDVVGILMRNGGYIEGVLWGRISVDGDDSTAVLSEMILSSRFREQINLIMLDGFALGGFNIVDIDELNKVTGIPVVTFTLKVPSPPNIERALKGKVQGWEEKLELISRRKVDRIEIRGREAYISRAGIGLDEALKMIDSSIVRGFTPEPLRVAHLVASALGRGESTQR